MIVFPIQPTLYFGCSMLTFLGSLSPKHSPRSSNTSCCNQQKAGHFQTTHIPGNSSQYSKLCCTSQFLQEHTNINFVAWEFARDRENSQGVGTFSRDYSECYNTIHHTVSTSDTTEDAWAYFPSCLYLKMLYSLRNS